MKRLGAFFLCATFSLVLTVVTAIAQAPVPLGTAGPFAALAGSGITNTGATTITGDVGSHPTLTQTGFAAVVLTGTNHGGDAVTQGAKIALRNAFLDAAGRLGATVVAGDLGGQLLTPGVYKDSGAPASLGLTGILRLDAEGDTNAVFIFQSASTLTTEVGSSIVLMNGAQACNVFWQVGSAATLKTTTTFVGTILANDDISLQAGTTVAGRLLAGAQAGGAGALTLINNTITTPVCAVPPVPPVPPVAQFPDLTITKSHSGNFQQGGSGSYTLTVTNIGEIATGGMVAVSDTLPAGLTATDISGPGWGCTLTSLSCTRSDVLAAGAAYPPITVTVMVANSPLIGTPVENPRTFQRGDIFVSMGDGTVQWRRRDWTLVKILTSVTDGQAKGMAFDASGNLFLTHYFGTSLSGNGVVKFDRNGNLVGLFGSGYDCNPSSIVFDNAGNAYVGHADCSGDILKLDSQGNLLAVYNVAVENRGSSHILLDPDQCTMYYTSQGPYVKRFNVCTYTQMSDFNSTPLPDAVGGAHQIVLLPDGGLLVANFGVVARLDASGNLVRTFDKPGDTHCWLGAALDPDGDSFWATNWCDSSATRFDLVTGNVIESHVADDTAYMVKQIILAGAEQPDIAVPQGPRSVINTAVVSGGGEENTDNNSASDSTTIIIQPPTPVLSISSNSLVAAYCTGVGWILGVTNPVPNAAVHLTGTTDGQSWSVPGWATTDANGSVNVGGTFTEGTEGNYTLRVEIGGKASNTLSFAVSDCRQ